MMNKDLKKFIILLIVSIMVAFVATFSYFSYKDYQLEKKKEEVLNIFKFTSERNDSPKEIFEQEILKSLEESSYVKEDMRSLYRRILDKINDVRVYTYRNNDDENKKVIVNFMKDEIVEEFLENDKLIKKIEIYPYEDYSSYDLKLFENNSKITTLYYDVLNENFASKNALIEYEDGRKIEFTHQRGIKNGEAVEYLPNGDRIEFQYINGARRGQAEKLFSNGDREIFIYGANETKNGGSIYYFANGDREEVAYENGVLNGEARYIYSDGEVEYYSYINGKRVEN